jgi:hypothetical protein
MVLSIDDCPAVAATLSCRVGGLRVHFIAMSITLADAYLKTARAKKHLDSLGEELRIFAESKPHRFSTERDVENQRYIVRVKIGQPPDSFPLIAGDFFSCLRSSLDHLVWSLAKLRRTYPLHTQFPILDEPDGKAIRNCTSGVPTEARKIIESLQPYRKGNAMRSHFLWQLHTLSIVDKHRRLATRGDATIANFPDFPRRYLHLLEFDNAGVVSAPLHLESKMRLDPHGIYNVFFGDPIEGVEVDVDGLNRMYEFVTNNVIPRFTRFFK